MPQTKHTRGRHRHRHRIFLAQFHLVHSQYSSQVTPLSSRVLAAHKKYQDLDDHLESVRLSLPADTHQRLVWSVNRLGEQYAWWNLRFDRLKLALRLCESYIAHIERTPTYKAPKSSPSDLIVRAVRARFGTLPPYPLDPFEEDVPSTPKV